MRMAADLGVAVAVFAAMGYVFVGRFCLLWVTMPAGIVVVVLGLLAGAAVVLARTMNVLAGGGDGLLIRPGWLVSHVQDGDRAWPEYFYGQVLLDLDAIVVWSVSLVRVAGTRALNRLRTGRRCTAVLLAWPVTLPAAVGLASFAAGVFIALAFSALVFAVVTALVWALGLSVLALVRGADAVRRRRRTAICPHCYHVTGRPAYRCAGPHSERDRERRRDLHFGIRAGSLGVWWRRCGCGARLPTAVYRAARVLDAHCPSCCLPLPRNAAVARELRISIFGVSSAGKTELVDAAVKRLLREQRGAAVELLGVCRSNPLPAGRPAEAGSGQLPSTTSLMIRDGRQETVVHIFDAAGTDLLNPRLSADLTYLDHSHTLVFVLDPMSVRAVHGRPAVPAVEAEYSYHALVARLRQYGVDTRRLRLAFVVSKADLLAPPGAGNGEVPSSESVRAWLAHNDLANMVTAAGRDFAAVRYFRCSTVVPEAGDAAEPIAWLLAGDGVLQFTDE